MVDKRLPGWKWALFPCKDHRFRYATKNIHWSSVCHFLHFLVFLIRNQLLLRDVFELFEGHAHILLVDQFDSGAEYWMHALKSKDPLIIQIISLWFMGSQSLKGSSLMMLRWFHWNRECLLELLFFCFIIQNWLLPLIKVSSEQMLTLFCFHRHKQQSQSLLLFTNIPWFHFFIFLIFLLQKHHELPLLLFGLLILFLQAFDLILQYIFLLFYSHKFFIQFSFGWLFLFQLERDFFQLFNVFHLRFRWNFKLLCVHLWFYFWQFDIFLLYLAKHFCVGCCLWNSFFLVCAFTFVLFWWYFRHQVWSVGFQICFVVYHLGVF